MVICDYSPVCFCLSNTYNDINHVHHVPQHQHSHHHHEGKPRFGHHFPNHLVSAPISNHSNPLWTIMVICFTHKSSPGTPGIPEVIPRVTPRPVSPHGCPAQQHDWSTKAQGMGFRQGNLEFGNLIFNIRYFLFLETI